MNNNIIYFAHRGIYNNINIPENSLKAFKKALSLNYPIELDIELTKDNEIVVVHDDNLKRLVGSKIYVKDCTYKELSKYSLLNTKEKIPTLKEVLELVQGKVLLNIEIKKIDNYKILIDKLLSILNNYTGSYIFQSFDIKTLIYLKKMIPNIKRGILISNKTNYYIYKYNLYKILNKLSISNFISINKNIYSINKLKKYPTLVWTIKDKKEITNKIITEGYVCDNLPYSNKGRI